MFGTIIDLSRDHAKALDSIRVNPEFDSNEIDESHRHWSKREMEHQSLGDRPDSMKQSHEASPQNAEPSID
jgi:predicted nucleotidyltransferase component of viral defense system